ncbi:MAG: peptidase Ste24p [Frankiales bacterium]|nr:peptidase Ste24p [Frankiales bacterium]
MLLAAGVLAACLLLVGLVLPPLLARAAWPARAPVLALVLWQAAGLAGGLLILVLCATLALAPLGDTHLHGLRHLDRAGPLTVVAGAVGTAVLLRLLTVLLVSTARTLRARHRNRVLVDLVAEPNLLLRGASVVDHDVPVAYCLPGFRPRLVLSRGALSLLSYDELRAVLAHERAHLLQRHDLVVLPFVALGATFPALPAVRTARAEVALLIELLADDRAARRHDRQHLARALWKIGTGAAPTGALGMAGDDVLLRARRLLDPPQRLGRGTAVAVSGLAAVVATSPLVGIVIPLMV